MVKRIREHMENILTEEGLDAFLEMAKQEDGFVGNEDAKQMFGRLDSNIKKASKKAMKKGFDTNLHNQEISNEEV
jgi:hypothetical protein